MIDTDPRIRKVVEAAVKLRMAWLQDGGNAYGRPADNMTISAMDALHVSLKEAGFDYGAETTCKILGLPYAAH